MLHLFLVQLVRDIHLVEIWFYQGNSLHEMLIQPERGLMGCPAPMPWLWSASIHLHGLGCGFSQSGEKVMTVGMSAVKLLSWQPLDDKMLMPCPFLVGRRCSGNLVLGLSVSSITQHCWRGGLTIIFPGFACQTIIFCDLACMTSHLFIKTALRGQRGQLTILVLRFPLRNEQNGTQKCSPAVSEKDIHFFHHRGNSK